MVSQTSATEGGVVYTLVFVNNSSNFGDACVYQQDPNIGAANAQSLAWFSKAAYPNTNIVFQWSINYNFVWSETGPLAPGVVFTASQHPSADLSTTNQITLTKVGGAYNFINQGKGATPGTLSILEDGTVPKSEASVGIGMSGFGTFVVQAQPNWNLNFTPHPQYWITFGTYTQGQVMNISSISNAQQIEFPENVFSLTVTLNSNNTWTVMRTAEMNAQYLRDKKRYPELLWGQEPGGPYSGPAGGARRGAAEPEVRRLGAGGRRGAQDAEDASCARTDDADPGEPGPHEATGGKTVGTLRSGYSHSWEASDRYSKLSLDWSGGQAGTGKVSVKIPKTGGATSYSVPQTDIAVSQQSGTLTNNTDRTIEYTLS